MLGVARERMKEVTQQHNKILYKFFFFFSNQEKPNRRTRLEQSNNEKVFSQEEATSCYLDSSIHSKTTRGDASVCQQKEFGSSSSSLHSTRKREKEKDVTDPCYHPLGSTM